MTRQGIIARLFIGRGESVVKKSVICSSANKYVFYIT